MARRHGGYGWSYRLRLAASRAGVDLDRLAERYPYRWVVVGVLVVAIAAAAFLVAHVGGPGRKPVSQAGGTRTPAAPTSSPAAGGPGPGPSATGEPVAGIDGCVNATVARLGLDGQVGQLLMIGTPIASPAGLADTVRRYRLGGVFLAGRSTQPAATLRTGIRGLQSAAGAVPLQIAADQEGGEVQTLKGADFPAV